MKLTMWTYEGPPHVGAMRIAASMQGVHYVLHAPQGDTYADLLFTMIERRPSRPPVTYTTFQARDLAGSTADVFKTACRDAITRFQPDALLVGASCTAELLQDDPAGLARTLDVRIPVVPLELPSYQKKEHWGAAETFYRSSGIYRRARTSGAGGPEQLQHPRSFRPRFPQPRRRDGNLPPARRKRHRCPGRGAARGDGRRSRSPAGGCLQYRALSEIGESAARYLKKQFGMPFVSTVPIGVGATRTFLAEVRALAGLSNDEPVGEAEDRATWYARSVDSNYLTNKRVFVFGDATHAIAAARIAARELGFKVCGLGTYMREFAREVREAAEEFGIEALITDDHLDVEQAIIDARPELVLGTQMERHIAKRLRVPCAVISAPVHVQDFPARYSPQMGFEGANVIFDSWSIR